MEDDGNCVQRCFEEEKGKPLLAPNWSEVEVVDLNVLMRLVMTYHKSGWINKLIGCKKEISL